MNFYIGVLLLLSDASGVTAIEHAPISSLIAIAIISGAASGAHLGREFSEAGAALK